MFIQQPHVRQKAWLLLTIDNLGLLFGLIAAYSTERPH